MEEKIENQATQEITQNDVLSLLRHLESNRAAFFRCGDRHEKLRELFPEYATELEECFIDVNRKLDNLTGRVIFNFRDLLENRDPLKHQPY